jgi:hypothetical protein
MERQWSPLKAWLSFFSKIKWASNRGPFKLIIHFCLSIYSENFIHFFYPLNIGSYSVEENQMNSTLQSENDFHQAIKCQFVDRNPEVEVPGDAIAFGSLDRCVV